MTEHTHAPGRKKQRGENQQAHEKLVQKLEQYSKTWNALLNIMTLKKCRLQNKDLKESLGNASL